MDSMVALEPETFSVTPFTLKTVSVVSVTSLNAPSANTGVSSAMIELENTNFLILMSVR